MEHNELLDTINGAIARALSNVHTVAIARVTAVNAKTIDCKPVINRVVDGEEIELPVFIEVPPVFMQGGSSYTAHPIEVGDYAVLLITERCFDRWYDGRDDAAPLALRMHDYSDGLALVGINPLAAAITIPSLIQQTGDTNQDGDYTHQGDTEQTGDYVHAGDVFRIGNMDVTGLFELLGNLLVTGAITCSTTVSAAGFSGLAGAPVSASVDIETSAAMKAASFTAGGLVGASGTFTTNDSKTVTVTGGIITSIV